MPFADGSFDRVISAIALPYMNIQKALAEIHRILVPGGGGVTNPASTEFHNS